MRFLLSQKALLLFYSLSILPCYLNASCRDALSADEQFNNDVYAALRVITENPAPDTRLSFLESSEIPTVPEINSEVPFIRNRFGTASKLLSKNWENDASPNYRALAFMCSKNPAACKRFSDVTSVAELDSIFERHFIEITGKKIRGKNTQPWGAVDRKFNLFDVNYKTERDGITPRVGLTVEGKNGIKISFGKDWYQYDFVIPPKMGDASSMGLNTLMLFDTTLRARSREGSHYTRRMSNNLRATDKALMEKAFSTKTPQELMEFRIKFEDGSSLSTTFTYPKQMIEPHTGPYQDFIRAPRQLYIEAAKLNKRIASAELVAVFPSETIRATRQIEGANLTAPSVLEAERWQENDLYMLEAIRNQIGHVPVAFSAITGTQERSIARESIFRTHWVESPEQ